MANVNQATEQARDGQIIAGIGKRLQNVTSIVLLGTAYSPSALSKVFQDHLNALANLAALRSQLKDALQAVRAQAAEATKLARALKAYLLNANGESSSVLGDFGFTVPTVKQRDPVTQVIAAERLRATRKRRGTTGKVARKSIKGVLPATISLDTNSGAPAPEPGTATAAGASNGAAPRPGGTQ